MASSRFGMGFSFHDAPGPGKSCYRKVKEILTAGVGWIARSERDRAHAHVTIIDVPHSSAESRERRRVSWGIVNRFTSAIRLS
jgi:hypothetical protein